MPGQPYRVELESVHWPSVLPSLRLFDTFKHAIHPAKLLLAYTLVTLLYVGGQVLDLLWQDDVFAAVVTSEVSAFGGLVRSALGLDFGLGRLLATGRADRGVAGAVATMFWGVPSRLWASHPWFLVIYGLYTFGLTCLFGGAISRMAAEQACRGMRQRPERALRFAASRYLWFVLAPLIPLLVAGVLALVITLGGLVFFNLPGTDIVGGALYFVFLLLGFLLTLTLVCLAVGGHLLFPAIAVENADAFDAISRAYNYVLGRPWRFLLYAIVAVLFFAVTYLLVALALLTVVAVTLMVTGWGSFVDVATAVDRFDEIASFAAGASPWSEGTATVAGWLVGFWIRALLLLLPAYAISYYFCACNWMYLLLRLAADRVYFDDLYLPEKATAPGTAVDKAEPAADEATPPLDAPPLNAPPLDSPADEKTDTPPTT